MMNIFMLSLASAVMKVVKQVLADSTLLRDCLRSGTLSSDESPNNVILNRIPKSIFVDTFYPSFQRQQRNRLPRYMFPNFRQTWFCTMELSQSDQGRMRNSKRNSTIIHQDSRNKDENKRKMIRKENEKTYHLVLNFMRPHV